MAKSKAAKKKTVMQDMADYMKRRLMFTRIFGILLCVAAILCMVAYYREVFNTWLCMIILAFCMGSIFNANSFLQDIKVGNPWQRVNGVVAVLFYILVAFLIVYGFVTGELTLQF